MNLYDFQMCVSWHAGFLQLGFRASYQMEGHTCHVRNELGQILFSSPFERFSCDTIAVDWYQV